MTAIVDAIRHMHSTQRESHNATIIARAEALAPKKASNRWKRNVNTLMHLCEVDAEEKLPDIWQQLANSDKKSDGFVLNAAFKCQAAKDMVEAPLATTRLSTIIVGLNWGSIDTDDLVEGLHPFLTASMEPSTAAKLNTIGLQHDAVLAGAAVSLKDIIDLSNMDKINFPVQFFQAMARLQQYVVALKVLLGENHRLMLVLGRFIMELNRRRNKLEYHCWSEPLFPSSVLRTVQLRMILYFNSAANGVRVPVPDFQSTLCQIETQELNPPPLPSIYMNPQNISWSGEMILNSMETDLKEKVLQAAEKKVDKALHGGPIYLFFMHKLIMATSETAMRGLTDKITSLKLTSFKGENVHTAGNYLKGALKILERHEKTPQDINLLLFRIFSNCSTKAFTKYMENIESTLETDELFDNERKMTAEDIILAAENKYADLLGQDKWEAKSTTANQESTFTAETSDIICFNCGGIGHTVAECPQPKNDEMILRRRKIILNNRNNSGGAGRGNGGGRGRGRGRGGRGRGRGRGRGGRNGGRGNGNNNENETEDSNLKKPPKPTEAHTKKVNGKQLHWCGRCAKWTGHDTASHKNNDEGGEVEDTPPAEGNLADINALSFRGALCSSLNC